MFRGEKTLFLPSTMKLEVVNSSKKMVLKYRITRHHIPEDQYLHILRRKNVRS